MKKIISILVLTFLVGCSASEEPKTIGPDCNCVEEFYLMYPRVGGGGLIYEFQFSRPIDFDCVNEEYGIYYGVSNENYNTAKVVCE